MSKSLHLFILGSLFSASLFGQGNSHLIGRYVMADPRGSATDEEIEISLDDDEGFGFAYVNEFAPALSLELSVARIEPSLLASADDFPVPVRLGELEMTPITAAIRYHFLPGARVSPYVGAGAAYVLYDELRFEDDDDDTVDFENSLGYLASAGVDFRVTDFIGINVDAKYLKSESEASGEGDPESLDFEIDPLITSVGVSFRF